MTTAFADGSFPTEIGIYLGPFGVGHRRRRQHPFDHNQGNACFQVVNRRYANRFATVVTTNRGLPTWAELFGGDGVVAAAIRTASSMAPPSSTSRGPPGSSVNTRPLIPIPLCGSSTSRPTVRPGVAKPGHLEPDVERVVR